MVSFKAPWSWSFILPTCLLSVVFLGAAVTFALGGIWFAAILLFGILACLAPFSILKFSITEDALLVHRLFWNTRIGLTNLQSVYFNANAMDNSVRTGGVDGLFAMVGYFNNHVLGDYRAFVTNPENAVILQFSTETIVLSPATPDLFVKTLRQHCPSA